MTTYEESISAAMFEQDASLLSDAQIALFRDNPDLLDLVGDRETVQFRYMWYFLFVSFLLVAASKVVRAVFSEYLEIPLFDIFSDLVFEMGAAVIGSVATVIFLNVQKRRQFESNLKFRADVIRRIGQLPK